jgi:hypothetical protein
MGGDWANTYIQRHVKMTNQFWCLAGDAQGVIIDSSTRKHVDEICCSKESLVPKFERHMSMCKKGGSYFNYIVMLTLCGAILLMCMRTTDIMRNDLCLKEGVKLDIFTAPIRLDCKDFSVKFPLN